VRTDALCASRLVEQRNHLLVVTGARVIDYFDAAKIDARLARGRANSVFASQDRDARQPPVRGGAGGRDSARIFALRQDDVLQVGRGALANVFENSQGIVRVQLFVVSCSVKSRANLS